MEMSSTLVALCLLCLALSASAAPSARRSRAAALGDSADTLRENKLTAAFREAPTEPPRPLHRQNKALNFLGFFPSFLSSGLDYGEDDDDVTFAVNDDNVAEEELSRTLPTRRRPQNKNKPQQQQHQQQQQQPNNNYASDSINSLQYDNSPIFYIRLPPTPYMFVPGLGYVSQPPNLGPPMAPPPPQVDPFINVPIDFVSNGKPTNVYQWPGAPAYPTQVDPYGYGAPPPPPVPAYRPPMDPGYGYTKPQRKPQPSNTKVTNLKGPFVFNGKPNDNVFVLRDTYNSLYSDALQNFYP